MTNEASSSASAAEPVGQMPRLVRFRLDAVSPDASAEDILGGVVVGLLTTGRVEELGVAWERALEQWARREQAAEPTGRTFDISEGSVAVPIGTSSRGLFCVGMNYRSHRDEVDVSLGKYGEEQPVVFSKVAETLIADGDALAISTEPSTEFDWEVELGVVIGRVGRFIRASEAAAYVGGYTLVNDVTARDAQRAHSQWFLGKNVHRSTPVGPHVLHPELLGWPPEGRLRLSINGEEKQDANLRDMVYDVPVLIETISRYLELRPGDIISTGSPAGVGFTREPPEFLTKGDVIRAELVGLLTLENEVS